MSILAGKHLFRFSLVFIYLINTTTLAQPVPRFIAYFCVNASTYTENSTYRRNLDTTLSTLPTTNSGLGFYNFSTGQGNDRVNSVSLCRGDVNLDVCQRCVNDSIVRLRELCPNQKEAIGYYDNCLLQYSNEAILGNRRINKFYVSYNNTQISSDVDQFNSDLRPLMDELRVRAAAGSALRKFATGNTTGPDFSTIYALVQCTPDLSNDQCNDCLEDPINRIAISFNGSVGGRILLPMCNFRYEINRFFNESTVANPNPTPPAETMDIGTAESLQYNFSTIKKSKK